MPKSKHRKSRHSGHRPKVSPQAIAKASTQSAATVATPIVKPAPARLAPRHITGAKAVPLPQLDYVKTELKVIGVITVVIMAAIVALYFALR